MKELHHHFTIVLTGLLLACTAVLPAEASRSSAAGNEQEKRNDNTLTLVARAPAQGGQLRCEMLSRVSWIGQELGPGTVSGLGNAQCNQDVISMTAEATLSRSSGAEFVRGPTDECDIVRDGECRFVESAVVLGCSPCTGTWETDADFLIEFPAAFVLIEVPEGCEPQGPNGVFCRLNSGLIEVV